MVGRFSGFRTQSGQTKINDELTVQKLSPYAKSADHYVYTDIDSGNLRWQQAICVGLHKSLEYIEVMSMRQWQNPRAQSAVQ